MIQSVSRPYPSGGVFALQEKNKNFFKIIKPNGPQASLRGCKEVEQMPCSPKQEKKTVLHRIFELDKAEHPMPKERADAVWEILEAMIESNASPPRDNPIQNIKK